MGSAETERFIASLIDDAVAPYAELLSAEALANLRDVVRVTLRTHPAAVRLVEEVAPREEVLQSADLPKDDAVAEKQAGRG